MSECICSSCKNLKSTNIKSNMETNGVVDEYTCEFGFPAEECADCEEEGCELTCDHYVSDQEEIEYFITNCTTCGKELKLVEHNRGNAVYCVTCYLTKGR